MCSKTVWSCVVLFKVSLFIQSWKQSEFVYLVCHLIKISSPKLRSAPLRRHEYNSVGFIFVTHSLIFSFLLLSEWRLTSPPALPHLSSPSFSLERRLFAAAKWRGRTGDSWTMRRSQCPLTSPLPSRVTGTSIAMATQTLDPCPKSSPSAFFLGTKTFRRHLCCCCTRWLKE